MICHADFIFYFCLCDVLFAFCIYIRVFSFRLEKFTNVLFEYLVCVIDVGFFSFMPIIYEFGCFSWNHTFPVFFFLFFHTICLFDLGPLLYL